MIRPLADKDAMFGLSYCLADMVERAAQVFDAMDERLRNG